MKFGERFFDQYTGKKLLRDPVTAVVELVANAWDAGATKVNINWPTDSNRNLSITDNGEGMTKEEFIRRWTTFSYDRLSEQGDSVRVSGHSNLPERKTFGRNGLGRFAGFCFSPSYRVSTSKNGQKVVYRVQKSSQGYPILLEKISESKFEGAGTSVDMGIISSSILPANRIKSEIGMRFLTDPNFEVFVNGEQIDFDDLPADGVETFWVDIPGSNENVRVVLIDAKKTDRSTKQHGIAWQVNGRLVGECSWQGSGHESFIDGRRIEARRYTFIIFAEILNVPEVIKEDWSGFRDDHPLYQKVKIAIQEKVRKILLSLTREKRDETFNNLKRENSERLREMLPLDRMKWESFVVKAQEECPSLAERDLAALSGIGLYPVSTDGLKTTETPYHV